MEVQFNETFVVMFLQDFRDRSLFMGGGMGKKIGGPEILATAKRGVLGKCFVIEGGGGVLKF